MRSSSSLLWLLLLGAGVASSGDPPAAAPSFECQGIGTKHPRLRNLTERECVKLGGKVVRGDVEKAAETAQPRNRAKTVAPECRDAITGPVKSVPRECVEKGARPRER
jgi:hypothetical protein